MAASEFVIHRLTNAEYLRMAERGALADMPVELLDGYLAEVSPQGPAHMRVIRILTRLLAGRADLLAIQGPLELEEGWVPEPDLALAELPRDQHPATALLAVEVAVTMHREARLKAPVYARARIPRYWIVDYPQQRVLEHTQPSAEGYGSIRELSGPDLLDAGVEGIESFAVGRLFD